MLKPLGLALVAVLAGNAHATSKSYATTVTRTLSDAASFGGCMALVTPPSNVGLNCPGGWVTFSCTGDFADRDAAQRGFEMAQIAQLMQRNVVLVVDDTKKHNGYCFASRIDLLSP
jgi:hypothetical protein